MVEADLSGKRFISSLNTETNEEALEIIFGKYTRLVTVLLMKKALKTINPENFLLSPLRALQMSRMARDMVGKSLEGKAIKIEQATKSSFARATTPSEKQGPPSGLQDRKSGSGGTRGRAHG